MNKIKEDSAADYITQALLMLLKNKPISEISISELCKKAGVTRMSFYRNFDSKEEVVKHYVEQITEDFLNTSGISFKENSTTDYFTTLFAHLKNNKELCEILHRDNLLSIVKQRFENVFVQIHHGEYDDYKSYFLAGGMYNVFLLWLINGFREEPDELAEKLLNFMEK